MEKPSTLDVARGLGYNITSRSDIDEKTI